jgi:hypothetical protein
MNATTLKKKFSFERTALLLRNRALEDLPSVLIGVGILFGVNLLSILATGYALFNNGNGQIWTVFLLGTGIVLSGYAFKEMHDEKAGLDWVLLPATSLEKYVAATFEYVILYPIVGALVLMGLSGLLSGLELLAGGPGGRIWTPGASLGSAMSTWANYAILSLWFLAGSATFRRKPLLKSVGSLMLYVLVMAGIVFSILMARRVPRGVAFNGGAYSFMWNGNGRYMAWPLSSGAVSALNIILNILMYGIVPVFCVGYGYLRVAEKEVRDEVQ